MALFELHKELSFTDIMRMRQLRQDNHLKKKKKKRPQTCSATHTIWVIWPAVVQLQSQSHRLTNVCKCEMWQLTNQKKTNA